MRRLNSMRLDPLQLCRTTRVDSCQSPPWRSAWARARITVAGHNRCTDMAPMFDTAQTHQAQAVKNEPDPACTQRAERHRTGSRPLEALETPCKLF